MEIVLEEDTYERTGLFTDTKRCKRCDFCHSGWKGPTEGAGDRCHAGGTGKTVFLYCPGERLLSGAYGKWICGRDGHEPGVPDGAPGGKSGKTSGTEEVHSKVLSSTSSGST